VSWRIADEASRTWTRFHDGWGAVPRERRSRFAWTLAAGWAASLVLVLAMTAGVQALDGSRMHAWEAAFLERFIALAPFGYETAVFLESPGNGVVLVTLAVCVSILFARAGRPLHALAMLAACLIGATVVGLGWVLWERDRPEFLYPGVPGSGLSAFPSGHAAMSIPTYGLLVWLWVRASTSIAERVFGASLLVALVALVVGARLVLGAHWPSDVAAGTLLGVVWLGVVAGALQRAEGDVGPRPGAGGLLAAADPADQPGPRRWGSERGRQRR
jgi:undecaprenyl-diphosphatase